MIAQVANKPQARFLMLGDLNVSPGLARRLAPALAFRYHALPVAEDRGRITIAMADPNDALAREAVINALGAPSRVVGCDPMTIDALLTEVWPEMKQQSPQLLVCAHASPEADGVISYGRALGELMNAHVSFFAPVTGDRTDCEAAARVAQNGGYDLVIWGEPKQSLGQLLWSGPLCRKAVRRVDCSFLLARRPHWPLKRILLVVRGDGTDNVAVNWVVRLARVSGARVTALAVVPPVPAMYDRCARMHQGIDALLKTNTQLGQQMRRMAQWLVEWELEGTLRLRQGEPDVQIRQEVAEEEYDLIVTGFGSQNPAKRWIAGDWVASMLGWVDRPVLIAKQPKQENCHLIDLM